MRAVVLSNGRIEQPDMLRARLADWGPDRVIAADAGATHAAELGLKVDLLIGDFDSLDEPTRATIQDAELRRYPPVKDETDLELALLAAAELGADQIVVAGAFGGRVDMTFGNILLLLHPALRGLDVQLWAGHQTAWLIDAPGGPVPGEVGDTVSLLPLAGDAEGIVTTGLAYPLEDEPLRVGPARGLSNVIDSAPASLTMRSGALLAVHTPGRA